MQVEEALARFLVQLEADGRSPHTRKQYERHVRALAAWLHESGRGALLADVGHEVVAAFLASSAARTRGDGQPKRSGSMNAMRSSLAGFFGYRQAQRRFTQWLACAGLGGRFTAHSARHAFAMKLYERTRDVLVVKEALGYASIGSTLVYTRASQDRVRAAMSEL